MEALLRYVFIAQIVAVSVMALSMVFLVVYAIRTWERLGAVARAAEAAEKAVRNLQGSRSTVDHPALPLEQAAADLARVSSSLEQIPPALEALRAQPPASVAAPMSAASPEQWRAEVAQELKQFRVLWTAFYGGKRDRLDARFAADLQGAARTIADQLLTRLASRPPGVEQPSQSALLGIVVRLHELADLELHMDDGRTLDEFDELGARLLEQIDQLR